MRKRGEGAIDRGAEGAKRDVTIEIIIIIISIDVTEKEEGAVRARLIEEKITKKVINVVVILNVRPLEQRIYILFPKSKYSTVFRVYLSIWVSRRS